MRTNIKDTSPAPDPRVTQPESSPWTFRAVRSRAWTGVGWGLFYAAAISGVLLLFADFDNGIIWMRTGPEPMSTLWLVWPAVPVLVLLAHVLGPLRLPRYWRMAPTIIAAVLALAIVLSVTGELLSTRSLTGLLASLVCIGVAGYLLGRKSRDVPPDA